MLLRAYKFRFYPNPEQIHRLEGMLDSCRFLYNSALQERQYAYQAGKPITCFEQIKELPQIREALPDYRNIHSQVLQDVLRRLEKAFQNYFRRVNERKGKVGYPRFKPKWRYKSFTNPQSGFKILVNGHVNLSKIGKLRVFMHRKILGTIKTLTAGRDRVVTSFTNSPKFLWIGRTI